MSEKYEALIKSVMEEFDCDRKEAMVFIEASGMYSIID